MKRFIFLPKDNIDQIPRTPGVYALATANETIYIGKAFNLKERIKNHFQQPSYRDDLFISKVTKIGYLETVSDIDALLLESQYIKRFQPRFNVLWKDDKDYFYVGITTSTTLRTSKEKLPRVFLTHQPSLPKPSLVKTKLGLGVEYIGPFVEGKTIKKALRLLRRVFPYYSQKKHPKSLCLYCHLHLCPGPNPDA